MKSPHFIKKISKCSLLAALCLFSISSVKGEPDPQATDLPNGRVFLKNGDLLRGNAISLDKEQNLHFESTQLNNQVLFPIEEILALKLDKKVVDLPAETLARVEINNRYNQPYGDVLIGSLKEFSPESITLETTYAGLITIRRSMVKSFKIMKTAAGNFYGPNNLDEWESPLPDSSWLFQEGSLTSQNQGDMIGKNVGMHNASHISFQLSYRERFKLGVILFSDSPEAAYPKLGSLLTLGTSSANLKIIDNVNKQKQANFNLQRSTYKIDPMKQSVTFEIFANSKAGVYNIYIDGVQAARIQTDPVDLKESQSGFSFLNDQSSLIKIKDIVIQPWDGNLPELHNPEDITKSPHNIKLNNGDEIPGTVGKVDDEYMLVETEYTPIKIPLSRIESFSLEKTGEQPIMKQGDVCVWFQNGGNLTLKLTNITKEKITGYGQAFGELEINVSDLSRIDFNIYDASLKEERAMAN